jgi:inorganic pyrophosphatase
MDIIIETPKGSRQKYTFDSKLRLFRFKKVLAAGLVFPFDFGFIPGTKGEDGDPLDVLVISEYEGFPGCVMDGRIIGCMQAKQTAGKKTIRNDRYLAVQEQSRLYEQVTTIEQLPAQLLTEIELIFKTYLQAEGKEVQFIGNLNARQAMEALAVSG